MIRVAAPDPRMTKTVRSTVRAEDRARWVALVAGSAEIQQRTERSENWLTVVRFVRDEGGRVTRDDGRRR